MLPIINVTNLVRVADLVASTAHGATNQRRKYTNQPYIVHPRAVALLVHSAMPSDLEAQAAALLHDVVEDTHITQAFILEVFGPDVAKLVSEVTDVSVPADGNRARRVSIDIEHLSRASARGQTIKVCDIIDNASTIMQHDPAFAATWMVEKRDTLKILTRADSKLLERAWSIVEEWERLPLDRKLQRAEPMNYGRGVMCG